MEIQILDVGFGNLGSLESACAEIGVKITWLTNSKQYKSSHPLIVPGIGTFDNAVSLVKQAGFESLLSDSNTKVIGICVGMQIFCETSDEGKLSGLGRLREKVSELKSSRIGCFSHGPNLNEGFFLHNYAITTSSKQYLEIWSGPVISEIRAKNFIGFQFHPERSNRVGLNILKRAIGELLNG